AFGQSWEAAVCLRFAKNQKPNTTINNTPINLAVLDILLVVDMLFCLLQSREVHCHHHSFHDSLGLGISHYETKLSKREKPLSSLLSLFHSTYGGDVLWAFSVSPSLVQALCHIKELLLFILFLVLAVVADIETQGVMLLLHPDKRFPSV